MPDTLQPKVYWILIGTNNMGVTWCSPEAAFVGILSVVEEIRTKKPGSFVVINALMPRSFDKMNGNVRKMNGKRLPQLWTATQGINVQLKTYSEKYDNVSYFDANEVFFSTSRSEVIEKRLMPDFLHPSPEGYRLWGDRIVKKLDTLLMKKKLLMKEKL